MSEQGIERARSQVAWAIERADDDDTVEFFNEGDPADSSRVVHVGDIREAIATPPVPAGEVGELVKRLDAMRNRNGLLYEDGDAVDDAIALLKRYAAALEDIRCSILCPVGPSPTLDEVQEIASAVLSSPSSLR